jgi:kynurenine formamidase
VALVTLREADIVVIHTGWGDLFQQYPAKNAVFNSGEPGIGKDAAKWLIGQKVVAVGADQWAVEGVSGVRRIRIEPGAN